MHDMMQCASDDASLVVSTVAVSTVTKAITLRNLPPELAAKLEEEAARTHSSLNATVIRLLQKAVFGDDKRSLGREKKRDLSSFAGSWSKAEADEFDAFLAEHRRIHPDDWR